MFEDYYPSVSYETLEPAQSKSSDWSEPTVCLSPGHFSGLQHSDPSSFPIWSPSKPPQESPAWRDSPLKSQKRPRGSVGGKALESDGGWGGKKLRRASQPEPKLNCPFYLKDPVRHHECSNCQFGDWARLREHLFRRHLQPVHCLICGIVFRGDVKEARSAKNCHERTCSEATFEKPPGITEEQEYLIRRLTGRGKRAANQDVWLAGWRILFPDSALPLQPFSTQRRPQDDASNLTDADLRLLDSGEFRLWIQSFPGLSSVGEDQRTEICKEFIQTFNAKLLGQDTRSSQVSRREDGTNQDAAFKPPSATQGEPSQFPQDLEFLGDAVGDTPSTSSAGPSPDADTESPLFASIRRILSADPSYAAEDVISAIRKRSGGKALALPGSGSEPAVIDGLTSKAPAGQESTSQGTKKRPIRTSGRSESPANKKQKTCTPSDADGDEEGGSGSNGDAGDDDDDKSSDGDGGDRDTDGNGGDGNDGGGDGDSGGGDGTPPRHTPDEPSEGWICPYCLKYVEITCIKGFEACGRPGFRSRDRLR